MRAEDILRADDLMIRGKLPGRARATVEAAETVYRHEFLPAPGDKTRLDQAALLAARALESLGRGGLEGCIRSLPVPENDRMTQRFRREAETLARLAETDASMIGHAEFLRALLAPLTGPQMNDVHTEIQSCVAALAALLQARADCSRLTRYELPINTPAANTSAPPSPICAAARSGGVSM